jgi:hypothetical protein
MQTPKAIPIAAAVEIGLLATANRLSHEEIEQLREAAIFDPENWVVAVKDELADVLASRRLATMTLPSHADIRRTKLAFKEGRLPIKPWEATAE